MAGNGERPRGLEDGEIASNMQGNNFQFGIDASLNQVYRSVSV